MRWQSHDDSGCRYHVSNTADQPDVSSSMSSQDDLFHSLKQNRFWGHVDHPPKDLMSVDYSTLHAEVHVIVFGYEGQDHHNGVYSHRATGMDGLPEDTIIAFESQDDAERYACMLEATMEPHAPRVMKLPAVDLADFCRETGYRGRLETRGSHTVPPECNVDITDWERATRLRQGQYVVIEDGDVCGEEQKQTSKSAANHELLDLYLAAGNSSSILESGPMSDGTVLDAIRNQLELLLPGGTDTDLESTA